MPSPPACATVGAVLTCDDVLVDEYAYLDDALPPDRHAAVTAHLARCHACRARAARGRRFLAALHRAARPTPAPLRLRVHAYARHAGWWARA